MTEVIWAQIVQPKVTLRDLRGKDCRTGDVVLLSKESFEEGQADPYAEPAYVAVAHDEAVPAGMRLLKVKGAEKAELIKRSAIADMSPSEAVSAIRDEKSLANLRKWLKTEDRTGVAQVISEQIAVLEGEAKK